MSFFVAPLILGGVKLGMHHLNKPKKYTPETGHFDNYISSQRQEIADKTLQNDMMTKASSAIGENVRRGYERSEYQSVQDGTAGSGIEANRNLQISAAGNEALGAASLDAVTAQQREDAAARARIEQTKLQKEQLLAEAKLRNEIAEDEHKRGYYQIAGETLGNIAIAGVDQALSQAEQWKQVEQAAQQAEIPIEGLKGLTKDPQAAMNMVQQAQQTAAKLGQNQQLVSYTNMRDNIDKFDSGQIVDALLDNKIGQEEFLQLRSDRQEYEKSMGTSLEKQQNLNYGKLSSQIDELSYEDIAADYSSNAIDDGHFEKLLSKINKAEDEPTTKWVKINGMNREYSVDSGEPTGRAVPLPDDPDAGAAQREAGYTSIDMINEIKIRNTQNGTERSQRQYEQLEQMLSEMNSNDYDVVSDKLWEFVDSLEIKTDDPDYFAGATFLSTDTPAVKEQKMKMSIYRDYIKRLNKVYQGNNYGHGKLSDEIDPREW
jgi:hypothetical protein